MAKTAEIKTRVNPELKKQAQQVYAHWGISLSEAMNAFLVKSVEVGGFPFDVRPPQRDWDALGLVRPGENGYVVSPAEMDEGEEDLYDDLV